MKLWQRRIQGVRILCAAVVGIIAGLACTACTRPGLTQVRDDEDIVVFLQELDLSCGFPPMASTVAITAAVSVRGTANRQPLRGRLWVGADSRFRSLRIESADGVAPQFIVVAQQALGVADDGSDGDATLLLPRQQLIVQRENSRRVLTVVLGLPLSAQEFVSAFTGCQNVGGSMEVTRLGANAAKVSIGTVRPVELFMRRSHRHPQWTLTAMSRAVHDGAFRWRAEYDRSNDGLLRTTRIVSQEGAGRMGRLFDVQLSLSRIQIGALVGPETFSFAGPLRARAVSLDTLQQQRSEPSRPLLSEGTFGR